MGTSIADRPPVMLPTTPEVRDGLRDLSSGNPDPALLSDLGRVLQDSSGPTILYGDRSVDEKLEESGARLLAVDGVSADHLTVVSGGLDGMERVLQAHLRRGDRLAIEDPGYPAVIVTLRAQNPLGSAISAARASDLRSVLGGFPDVLVIEDDHAAAVAGSSMHSIAEGRERWATIRSTAKTYGPEPAVGSRTR
jgi:DNA-binding transcriptional MocR family regulator